MFRQHFMAAIACLVLVSCTAPESARSRSSPLVSPGNGEPPLPAAARGVEVPQDKGYYVSQIADGLYWITEGVYTTMFLTTGEGVIVVDAPPSLSDKILMAIGEVTDEPITHVIYTHSHADHIAGAGIYPEGVKIIAHEETKAQLERMTDPTRPAPYGVFVGGSDIPMPNATFETAYSLTVGSQTLELAYHGPVHEPGNIYVYAPKQRVLLVIDVIFPGWSPFKEMAIAEDIPAFLNAHDQILAYDFDTLVSGHLSRLATREDVETQKEYFDDLMANAVVALQTTDFNAIAQKVGYGNTWRLFDTYLNAVTQTCADLTEPDWTDRLAGVDIYTYSHCWEAMMSLRVD